ncbi:type I restriction enzyme, S subunit [Fibrobacter sp. UWOV1]|uniref:restriction endonuclease subunit S n=1 Tax=Fibrobacter sp. UWOV1 TaxID=1896215 RepID=UPI00092439D2|nr:restriction endonuclease subunit S [Fibrobacter sp. UWOV1]SHL57517.1 type I restriction enzyme, S subunit [Fibrobacter sp. UWOV1]
MNTKLLKQKILDLAIRGKLTQQLKSDGTARELLEQISSKVSSSSSTLSSPRRRGSPSSSAAKTIIPLDKSEAPFEIPANWEWVRLGDVCDISSAKRVLKEDWKDSGIPFYRAREIAQLANGEKVKDDLFITKELYESLKRQYGVPQPGDILMSAVGTIGKTYIVQKNDCFYYKDASVICLKIRSLNISPTFLKILLASDFLQKQMYANSSGTTVDTITISVAQEYFFPLPPFAEQQRIVAKIEEAFAEIDAIEKNKELLKTHIKQTRQKILDLAIHGKLVPQNKSDEPASVLLERITRDNPHYEKMGLDERRETKDERDSNYKRHSREGGNLLAPISKDEIPFDIPENWVWCRLKDIANYGECDNVEVKRIPETAWILELEDIEKDSGKILHFFSKSERQINGVRHQFEKGDVLYSKLRTYLNKVLVASNDGYCTTEIMPIKTTFISNHYLCMVLRSRYFLDYTAMCGYGVKMPRLSTNDAKNGLIPLPPLAEQARIVAKIEELFSTLDQMERNLV